MITKVKRLHEDATLPSYGYPGDAGMDLAVVGRHTLNPGESRDLPTGIAVELPAGYWGRITGRSSTLRKRGLFINEGVIDEGYRGELLVYVTNRQSTPVEIEPGDRLAQLILHPVHQAPAEWADELSPSERGTNGFGSTGTGLVVDVQSALSKAAVDESGAHPGFSLKDDDTAIKMRQGAPVYLGGAVDLSKAVHDHLDWRHSRLWGEAGVWTYCPKCECTGITDPEQVIRKNMQALRAAPMAVFNLQEPSIGTPIEAWIRLEEFRLPGIVIFGTGYSDGPRSMFVDFLTRHPWAHLATGTSGIAEWVRSLIRQEVPQDT